MKNVYALFLVGILFFAQCSAQNIGVGTNSPDASAALEIKATGQGLLIPRTSTATRTSIVNPARGLVLYDTTTNSFWFHNGISWIQSGTAGTNWSLTGNSGTDTSVNFIGTSSNMPLRFKVNNQKAGLIGTSGSLFLGLGSGAQDPPGFGNTALGYQALMFNNNSTYSTAVGTDALYLDTSYGYNTAVGSLAMLQNRSGYGNTAVGTEALYYSKFGSRNTAIGNGTLYADSSGDDNTAVGSATLFANRLGSYNVAFGGYAMYNHIKNNSNTAVGYYAMNSDTSSQNNCALGTYALSNTQNSSNNVAIGTSALSSTKDGTGNTGIGYQALNNNTTGSNNTAIGSTANVSPGTLTNATAIGAGAVVNTSNSLVLGSNAKVGIGTSSPVSPLHIQVSGTDSYAGIILSSTLTGGKLLSINQGTAGKLNFTNPGIIDLVTMDFNNNRLGINITTPAHLLQLGTDDAFKPSTSVWGVLSDRRLKDNIHPFTDGLNVVLKMKPVWFNYNGLGGTTKGERAIGTVAQELQQLAPYMITEVKSSGSENPDTKYLGVNYHALFFVLVNSIQEQQQIVETQKNDIELLKEQVATLTKRLNELIKK